MILVGMKSILGFGQFWCVSKHVCSHVLAEDKLSSEPGRGLIGRAASGAAALSVLCQYNQTRIKISQADISLIKDTVLTRKSDNLKDRKGTRTLNPERSLVEF
jgi:hypothetical protein